MFPLSDHVTSIAIVAGEEEVFLSIRYEPSDKFSQEDLKAWLTYSVGEFLKKANVGFVEYGSVDFDVERP